MEEAVSGNTRPKQPLLLYSLHFDHSSLVKMMMIIVCDDNDEVEIMMFDLIMNIMILGKGLLKKKRRKKLTIVRLCMYV